MKKLKFYLLITAGLVTALPCIAMERDETESTFAIKKIQGKTIPELRAMEAVITYPLMPQTIGNVLTNENGEFKVGGVPSVNQNSIDELYNFLNTNIQNGYISDTVCHIISPIQEHKAARCSGATGLILEATDFTASNALFGSQRNIVLTSTRFNFKDSFIDVDPANTTFKIVSNTSLNSPIECLEFKPTKSPLFIQGDIDFENPNFGNFCVTNASLKIKFRK